ncbi:MAG: hypothetical protein ACK4HV_08490 [Parachlamydiaceae bacterium]
MIYLKECDTMILSIPPLLCTAIGAGCRVIEFSQNPIWREVGWAGARIFLHAATLAGTPLIIHRFALALILRISTLVTRNRLKDVSDISEFMEKRLTFATTALSLVPTIVFYGPWIFKSVDSFEKFINNAKGFYAETASRFDKLPA